MGAHRPALPLLEKALADDDPGVRSGAVWAIGEIGGEGAVALLEKALAGERADLRAGAVRALVRIGGERALPLLERAATLG